MSRPPATLTPLGIPGFGGQAFGLRLGRFRLLRGRLAVRLYWRGFRILTLAAASQLVSDCLDEFT